MLGFLKYTKVANKGFNVFSSDLKQAEHYEVPGLLWLQTLVLIKTAFKT